MLIGRETERSAIGEVLDEARAGRGGALVIRGETGVGKSALLRDAELRAGDMQVARAVGVEAESEIAFAAVDQILRPFRRLLARLPPQLSNAIDGSAPLAVTTAQRFAVGLAMLELLAGAAEEQPVLLLVDDAQWIDAPSMDAFHFVGRRLSTEALALLVATRDPPGSRLGFPELALGGLSAPDAVSLIATSTPDVAAPVAKALAEATGGNPLALEEALRSLSEQQLSGAELLPQLLPAGEAIALAYRGRLEPMSRGARHALLVAAANDTDDLAVLAAALTAAGSSLPVLEEGVAAGLIRLHEAAVEFPHPLARSAIYEAATPAERREAHRVLARAFGDAAQSDRRAWHLALAAEGPDEEIAAALEQSAFQALRRGGLSAAATTLARAAALTPGVDARVGRLAAAADAARQAGRIDQAVSLVEQGLRLSDDAQQRARLHEIHGDAEYSRVPSLATNAYLAAAELVEADDPGRAVLMLGNAVACLGPTGNYRAALRLVDRAVALHDARSDASAAGLAIGFAFSGRNAEAAEVLASRTADEWLRAFAGEPILLTELAYAQTTAERFDDAELILESVIAQARASTALGVLAYALQTACWGAAETGRWLNLWALGTEAVSLGEELGVVIDAVWAEALLCYVAAAQGRDDDYRTLAVKVDAAASAVASQELTVLTTTARGLVALGAGDADGAIAAFEAVQRAAREQLHNEQSWSRWHPNLAEAYVRAGRRDEAEALLAGVPEWRPADALVWGAACEARCRGLLAGADEIDEPFERALALHATAGNPFERARTELCYGERLRRARRRAEARGHLREAYVIFERLGAEPWSRRAVAELEATGVAPEPVAPPALAELTPHELRVAGIVASGATNQEIASRLFVTQKTVEYHLRSIYRKLGIRSRSELTGLYVAEQAAVVAA